MIEDRHDRNRQWRRRGGHYAWNWARMHHHHVSISGERAGARSVASRQHVFGSPRCNDDLRQLPSGHSDNASQRSKVSYLCRHCQPTDNHRAIFETVPAFQPQPNAKIHTLTRRYRRCRRLYPQHQAEIAFTFAVALRMRKAEVTAGLRHFRSARENGHGPSRSSYLKKGHNRTSRAQVRKPALDLEAARRRVALIRASPRAEGLP